MAPHFLGVSDCGVADVAVVVAFEPFGVVESVRVVHRLPLERIEDVG